MSTTDYSDKFYNLGKKHFAETIWEVPALIYFIKERNFTCDELHQLIMALEDIKGSDYDTSDTDIGDDSDSLREYRDNQ